MARPKSPTRSIHTAVRLPEELHQRLSEAGRGALAQEIKRRLEASFEFDAVDEPTRDLVGAIAEMAELIRRDGPEWHSSSYLRDALAEAITGWLQDRVPDEEQPQATPPQPTLWARADDSPRRAGKNLFSLYKMLFSTEAIQERAARWERKAKEDTLTAIKQTRESLERIEKAISIKPDSEDPK